MSAVPGKKVTMDMTKGEMLPLIVKFTLPLLAGYFLSQFYVMVDTWVVGNYVSNEAYAAVSCSALITMLLIGIFNGLSAGVSTLIAQYFGAKDYDTVSDLVHTAMAMTATVGTGLALIGIVITPWLLALMKTPAEVEPLAATYLRIYLAGLPGLLLYNIGSGILRAVGDSKRPFYFLAVSAVMNVILDLTFVLAMGWGVPGVGWATTIAHYVSAAFVLYTLLRHQGCARVYPKKIRFHGTLMKKILQVGLPSSVSQALPGFANIYGRGYVNYFGTDMMSAWGTYGRIDNIMLMPIQALMMAVITFVGQNLGARQPERARAGVKLASRIGLAVTALMIVPIMVFAPQLVWIFNKKTEVIELGSMIMRLFSPFFLILNYNYILSGAIRGMGRTKSTMYVSLFSYVVFRQVYMYVMAHYIANEPVPILMAYPTAWTVCFLGVLFVYLKSDFKSRLLDDKPKEAPPETPEAPAEPEPDTEQ